MRTSKPMSTISYNHPDFLKGKLDSLVRNKHIDFYAFVYHYAEADELKDHIHLYFQPSHMTNSADIAEFLQEFEDCSDLPLGCTLFRSSQPYDWLLYSMHEPSYLASKGECRQFVYSLDDFCTSNSNSLQQLFYEAMHSSDFAKSKALYDALRDGNEDLVRSMILSGFVPLNQVHSVLLVLSLNNTLIFRNGRESHTSIGNKKPISDKLLV